MENGLFREKEGPRRSRKHDIGAKAPGNGRGELVRQRAPQGGYRRGLRPELGGAESVGGHPVGLPPFPDTPYRATSLQGMHVFL
ncbi:hypothetical protein V5799_032348 [Amblyomma americanum]|uniref:Uncharacterized protein n=1 Tax=Amblyomma americanum TaxID=6943 RepID=A0AAQ4DRF3_AMBAM